MNINLVELQNKIHAQNVDMGLCDESRPFDVLVCLFHYELSEAMEGDRKGLMDDHLPQYPMFKVKMADYVIRVLDWLGVNKIAPHLVTVGQNKNASNCQFIAHCHNVTSEAFVEMLEENTKAAARWLMYGVGIAVHAIGDDAEKIILEKVECNKHRPE